MTELTRQKIKVVRSLRARGVDWSVICEHTGLTADDARNAMQRNHPSNKEPGEEQIIDGEPIAQRIERLKRELREHSLDQYRRHGAIRNSRLVGVRKTDAVG